ncbi:aldo/keto reductase [Zymobacter palmae]|uniref:Predicted oxidoreductases n=1 Tax=Zymobacter palmae TaxID=33074 RepID=A0A348HHF2_9GAMM|nr:aldo/keto reductase [Zymobacter palmae]BBG31054.1 predicted oxidoreductases [Zymobacter palmae]
MTMDTITLPKSDITATRIALGTWAIGGSSWGGTDDKQSIATVQSAIDRGITCIDTAPVYGCGHSEELVGKALKEGGRRDKTIIASKCGLNWKTDGTVFRDASPARLAQEIDDSLRRLQTDHIDIYQLHWPDSTVPIEESAEALRKIRESGKVRAIGVSNFNPEQVKAFEKVCPITTHQPPYNLFERDIEKDLLPTLIEQNIGTLTYGALCRGLLSGKIDRNRTFSGDDLRNSDPKFQPPRFEQYLNAVKELDAFALVNYDRTVLHLALRWLLDQKGVSIALWGARRPDQLDPVNDVMGWSLDEDAKAEIDRILDRNIKAPVGPEFMAPPLRTEI